MVNKKITNSINVVSVLIILMALLLGVVGQTNAWFTSEHKEGVEIVVNVGTLKLNVYQKLSDTQTVQIYTYTDNNAKEAAARKYITIADADKVIIPDKNIKSELILANVDEGAASMYLRFKFQLFARGINQDSEIKTRLIGVPLQSSSSVGFKYNTANNYYYYCNTSGANTLFNTGTTVTMMTHFVVDYEGLINSGLLTNISSETVYIKLTIEASTSPWNA